MSLWGGIKAFFEGWKNIENPPSWVQAAHDRWKIQLPTHPYNMTKHFIGKNYIYRVRHGQGMQGEAPVIGWYMKKRNNRKI